MLFIVLLSGALASTVVLGNSADNADDDTDNDVAPDPSEHIETRAGDILSNDTGEGNNVDAESLEGDSVFGGGDDDVLMGFTSDDSLHGGGGDDDIDGGDGDDYMQDTSGSNSFDGGDGNDQINTHRDLFINSRSEIVSVREASDAGAGFESSVFGGAGNDIVAIGNGVTANGGEGNDTFIFGGTVELEDAPVIEDYQKDEDCIILLVPEYDASAPPEISVLDSLGDAIISSDGEVVAVIRGAAGTITSDVIQVAATYSFS